MTRLEELLTAWLPAQRWFAGKGAAVDALRIEAAHVLVPGLPGLRLLVVAVVQNGRTDRYQVLLGLRAPESVPDELAHAVIGVCESPADLDGPPAVAAYDAAHDAAMTAHLLTGIAEHRDVGPVRFRSAPGAGVRTGLRSLVLTGEQSNTTLVYGEEYVLKTFRRLWPGLNPDLELTSALTEVGSEYVARPYGWIEADVVDPDTGRSSPTTLAMLQEHLRSATDGWVLAATSVRDLYASPGLPPEQAGGDFAGEAQRLGAATAAVHRDLARVLPTDVLGSEAQARLADRMTTRLRAAVAEVPQLAPHAEALHAAFEELGALGADLPVQRVHGDYHLGQVVRTDAGWVLLDFEGEPAVPVRERQKLSSPLRDVAGMLRSFDYAARYQLVGRTDDPELVAAARAWAQRNREAFCEGYAFGGGVDPEKHQVVLRAFEYDKAVYEVVYEARHRPHWISIPLDSITALTG
ncbi:maltokinase N-terminal cap-like domain-containing protein [Thermobifida cellulosilytica]|uniref:Maltokinase n=1 Tax=Thermobifida cellulosilytica TB100 TaxID=665004 RepID=A0A147KDF1_THECS|nr:phosphotransferase [Thermobifida cellulosilytica]KUP95279.1 aminoglycoside phosphotransferase [Thermobifida cellulosilytica TB100]